MLKANTNKEIRICLNGISNSANQLWHNYIIDLAENNDSCFYYNYSNSSETDQKFIQKNLKSVEIKDTDILKSDNYSTPHLFFADTPQNILVPEGVPQQTKFYSFFGGLDQTQILEQIEKINYYKISKVITDIFPEELTTPTNFKSEVYFLPPSFPKPLKNIHKQNNEEILFVHGKFRNLMDSKKQNEIIFSTLHQNKNIRVVNLNKIPIEDWFKVITPSDRCKKVCLSIDLPQLHHLFADFAAEKGLDFDYFDCELITSHQRYFTTGNENLLKSLQDLFPLNKKSLRENVRMIFKMRERENEVINNRTEQNINNIFEQKPIFLRNLNKQTPNENLHVCDPLNYILKDISGCEILISNYQYLLEVNQDDELNDFINLHTDLFIEAILKISCSLKDDPNDKFSFCSSLMLLKLCKLNFRSVTEQIFNIINENPTEFGICRIASYFISILYNYEFKSEDILFAKNKLLESKCPNEIKLSILISLIPKKHIATEFIKFWDKKIQGMVGANIINLISDDIIMPSEQLLILKDICNKEISLGLDNFLTHKSLAIIEILLGNSTGTAKILLNCSKYRFRHNFKPIYIFEIAYFCIFKNDFNEALSYIDLEPVNDSSSDYFKIASYSIQIITNKINNDTTQFNLRKQKNIWSTDHIFFCALNHYIVFTYHNHTKGAEKAYQILKNLNSNMFVLVDNVKNLKVNKEYNYLLNTGDLDYLYNNIPTVS